MMHKQKILELPLPSTALLRSPTLQTDGGELLLSMEFGDDGQKRSARLRFIKQRALRTRAEIHCTPWHVTNTFDTLCEVQDSTWVQELRFDSVPEWRDRWILRHYIIYLDSFGCLEVICESASLDDSSKNAGGT